MRWLKRLKHKLPSKRDIRFFIQRWTRGWDDSETWSMDQSLAKIILPRLKRFQEVRGGHPADMTDEEWESIIQEMVWGFEWFAAGKQYDYGERKEGRSESERAHEAIELFAKYYGHLWW
jgi:hypothetical protein